MDVGRLDECHVDAEALERVQEDVPRAAVQRCRRDDVVAGASEVEQREVLRRVTGGDGDRGRTAVQRGEALLEHVSRGVHDAGVDVAERAKAEQIGGVLGAFEVVRNRLIDRDGERVETGGGRVSHGSSLISESCSEGNDTRPPRP